jgi:hypothetical protein
LAATAARFAAFAIGHSSTPWGWPPPSDGLSFRDRRVIRRPRPRGCLSPGPTGRPNICCRNKTEGVSFLTGG